MSLASIPLPVIASMGALRHPEHALVPFATADRQVLEPLPLATVSVRTNVEGGVDLRIGNLETMSRMSSDGSVATNAFDITAVGTLRSGGRVLALVIHFGDGVPQDDGASGLPKWRLKRVIRQIEANIEQPISVAELAHAAGLSTSYFSQQFRAATGLKPHAYVMQRRIRYAQELLKDPRTSLIEAAIAAGFHTQAHFTRVFHKLVGQPPRRWRQDHCLDPDPDR